MLNIVSQIVCFAHLVNWKDVCEYEKLHKEQYQEQVIEMFIDHLESKWKFRYASGCHGQKWCKWRYDCSWLIYSFAYERGLQIKKHNSSSAYATFAKKDIWDVKRWDLVYFHKTRWPWPWHLAVAATWYDWVWLNIIDAVIPKWYPVVKERYIKLWKHKTYNLPDNSYRIYIIENGYIDQFIAENPPQELREIVQDIIENNTI